jgi:alpha-galactosidase
MPLAESHATHSQIIEATGLPGAMPRPIVVTMIGAGSFFTNSILKDVVLIPGNQGGELRLIDVDAERLDLAAKLMSKIVAEATNLELRTWKVRASTDRRELLPGTDYIVNSIEVSGLDCVLSDNDIPLEFGVSQNIGDTIGPGGLFKAMRTVPVWLEILRDAEELCPNALVLNYTNPMNVMCLAAARASSMEVVGLCHSVQGTSRMLAKFAGVPYEQVRWKCAGINHLAWFTELARVEGRGTGDERTGIDPRPLTLDPSLYPLLFELASDRESEFAKAEPVRTDMMLHFGAFITESSGHLSEYLPYYRKRPDLLAKYTDTGYRGEESFYANNWPRWRAEQDESRRLMIAGEKAIEFKRTLEYGAWIIESVEKNAPITIHGNVANHGLVTNLPSDGCVEVACHIDANRVQPTRFGPLPKQMAAICDWNMRMFDLAAEACIHRSKAMAKHALMLDPLTAACCSPAEISEMFDRMFAAQERYLPGFG